MQERRITKTAVENMIKKYALLAGITKPITPHKLRKTYGTALYRKTRDIYLTANALGHENVATTSKHYVDDTAESLREVADAISVRNNTDIPPAP
jgi:site-specific recombinase XerD